MFVIPVATLLPALIVPLATSSTVFPTASTPVVKTLPAAEVTSSATFPIVFNALLAKTVDAVIDKRTISNVEISKNFLFMFFLLFQIILLVLNYKSKIYIKKLGKMAKKRNSF